MDDITTSLENLSTLLDITARMARFSMAKSCTETEVRFFFKETKELLAQIYGLEPVEKVCATFQDTTLKIQESLAEEFPQEPDKTNTHKGVRKCVMNKKKVLRIIADRGSCGDISCDGEHGLNEGCCCPFFIKGCCIATRHKEHFVARMILDFASEEEE